MNDQPEFDLVPPPASALVESLRGVGYSMPTAIADLIDNSISAGASTVHIRSLWVGRNSVITLLDDGQGMDGDELTNAMRLGWCSPLVDRPATDLGRFGLGLKTASFSQCRRLTVASKKDGALSIRRWDLDHISRNDIN
ncbi:MAG: ATP-binding protein, partial [Magnetococcus sp. YQC-5]